MSAPVGSALVRFAPVSRANIRVACSSFAPATIAEHVMDPAITYLTF